MAAQAIADTRIKIGNVEVILRPQPGRGKISDARLRSAVAKALAHESKASPKAK
jgi:hypothetical protein